MLKNLNPEFFKEEKKFVEEVSQVTKSAVRVGYILVAFLFFGFGGWLVFANIDKAAIAIGEIAAGGNNRVVQHLEGGIIKAIHVKEGDSVKEGDILVSLSQTMAGANAEIVSTNLESAQGEFYRLTAERDGAEKLSFPKSWFNDPAKEAIMKLQNKIFEERRSTYLGKIEIYKERSNQLKSELTGMNSQLSSAREQLSYTQKELKDVEQLYASGNTTMNRLLSLKSRVSEIGGQIGSLTASLAKGKQAISENELTILNLKNEMMEDVGGKLKEVQLKIDEFKERGTAATDTLSRTEIRAPVDGIIKEMTFKTISGVIPPGAQVLTIVPKADELVAEVRINPIDIDIVHPGLKAKVRLSSYGARHVPMLLGELYYISADASKDERTGQSYYTGKVKIDLNEAKEYIEKDITEVLYPGMPVEVYVNIGARSPLQYLIEPITKTFRKSFRED